MVRHEDSGFLQMYERFGALVPYPRLSSTLSNWTRIVSPTGMKNIYKARVLWWAGLKQSTGKLLATVIVRKRTSISGCTPLSLQGSVGSISWRR